MVSRECAIGSRGIYHLPSTALLVVLELLLNHTNHDLIRHKPALIHDLLCLLAQLGLRGDLSAEHVTCCQMAAAKFLLDLRGLSSLACQETYRSVICVALSVHEVLGYARRIHVPAPGGPIKIMRMPSLLELP